MIYIYNVSIHEPYIATECNVYCWELDNPKLWVETRQFQFAYWLSFGAFAAHDLRHSVSVYLMRGLLVIMTQSAWIHFTTAG